MSEKHDCETCAFRSKYDDNPRSFLGRIWRWHAGWCPGWKSYITSLPDATRRELAQAYKMTKYTH
jgi:hypothetical protein